MGLRNKIIFFIVTTVLLGSIIYLIIARDDEKKEPAVEEVKPTTATIEYIDYDKYLELRSEAYETETYAILIYNEEDEISQTFLEEIKIAFSEREAVVYILNRQDLNDEQYSIVIDDVTDVMNYKNPQIIIPTLLVMSEGDVVFSRAGLMYKEELMENLNAKSIE